jgi:DNA-binding IclR family transcriptional regulator
MSGRVVNTVRATEKAAHVIDGLRELDGAGVTELADHLGYNKSTVHHHLTTLEDQKLLVKDEGQYRLSLRFFELGEYVRRQNDIYKVAKEEIDTLAEETGELANLMLEEHGRGTYVHIAAGENSVNLDTTIGTKQYLHTCALGKAMLAEMSVERVNEIIDRHGLPAETPNTVTDRATLEAELEEIRERGVAFDGEERAKAIRCVATSINDTSGELLGAVSVSGPSSRMRGARFEEEIPALLRNTAEIVSINVSYP